MITKTRLVRGGLVATLISTIYVLANLGNHVVDVAIKNGHS